MERALINIFREEQPIERVVKITEYLGDEKYKAVDAYGRPWVVRSSKTKQPGQFVQVQLGRVIDDAKPFSKSEEVSV